MDDCCSKTYNNGLVDSSSYIICGSDSLVKNNNGKGKTELSSSHPLDGNIKTNKIDETCVKVSAPKPMTSTLKKPVAILKNRAIDAKIATPIKVSLEPYCPIKLDSIKQLKDSTKKLLCLLEDIQTKTNFKVFPIADTTEIRLAQIAAEDIKEPVNTDASDEALKKLEAKTKALNTIYLEDEDDDCSIFKRLTRKCNCLNQLEYNDFIIHFNENTKYFTSTTGEIIKNMRILKKFLYMGSKYTKNALIFLNEGLADSGYAEKVEITQGCSHSDMCNVFEDNSIVTTCISWPCKLEYYGDTVTQNLAASFVYKLAQLEEGRRYLKFTSKVTIDIKKVLRKRGSKLDIDTVELLNAALKVMHPPMTQHVNGIYHFRHLDEGYGSGNFKALLQFRAYMSIDEVFTHLDLLNNLSSDEKGKMELKRNLPGLLQLFKDMLQQYDNSEMNIIITNILNNIVSKNMFQENNRSDWPKALIMANIATEPVKTRNETIQQPEKKTHKKPNKSRIFLNRGHKAIGGPADHNKSKKLIKDRRPIIVVPVEKK
ncbi:unnamed protein product [Spodoptera littoralis]|uniref:Uncharacterized protein n=1 Tax=Spodoptera littoralis TaxID=7109 RepID=A0A9P0HZ15_SPOLI|nr:unnamed protein product [Spodoptera littoralis]CAH1636405.1 unnamed protein product [Spodoptera littoralis]